MRVSMKVEYFFDWDTTRQCKDLETWSFAIFSRVSIVQNRNSL